MTEDQFHANHENDLSADLHATPTQSLYGIPDPGYRVPPSVRRQHDTFANAFGQNFGETFDIRSVTWFDDLLGLAPSHSI